MGKYNIYTDGSALGKTPNYIGGWAAVIVYLPAEDSKEPEIIDVLKGSKYPGTNNAMELTAVLEAIRFVKKTQKEEPDAEFEIFSDSQLALRTVTEWLSTWSVNGWTSSTGRPVANMEIVKAIHEETRFPVKNLKYTHVKGHSGDFFNEMADDWAVDQSTQLKQKLLKERGEV